MSESKNPEAVFVAKIAAGATHEIRNVLATIKESAGVIKDMMALMESGRPLEPQRIERVLQRIDAQVGRGVDLISSLNRFAHSLDHAKSKIDLNQQVQQIVVLCRHSVHRKGHSLEVEADGRALEVEVDALLLQMALYLAMQSCLEQLPSKGAISIRTGVADGPRRMVVEFMAQPEASVAPTAPDRTESWTGLNQALGRIGGSVDSAPATCGFSVSIPAA